MGEIITAQGNRALTQTNLAVRIEMVTDASIALYAALDSQNLINIRANALIFKNSFFALFRRLHYTLEKFYGSSKKERKKFDKLNKYVDDAISKGKPVDACELLKKWDDFLDMLNESGITDITFSDGDPETAFSEA